MINQASERDINQSIYSDLFKDVYGFRPRTDISGWSDETLDEECEGLQQMLNEQQEDEGAQSMLDNDFISTFFEEN